MGPHRDQELRPGAAKPGCDTVCGLLNRRFGFQLRNSYSFLLCGNEMLRSFQSLSMTFFA